MGQHALLAMCSMQTFFLACDSYLWQLQLWSMLLTSGSITLQNSDRHGENAQGISA